MQEEDRPIHFSTELFHAPKRHDIQALQKLYYDLSQTRQAAYTGSDFSPQGPPKFFSRRGAQTQSLAVFLPKQLVVVEEWVDMPFASFLDRVEVVTRHFMKGLGVSVIGLQTATIRTTFALTHHDDSRIFLIDRVCSQEGRIGPYFQRPIAIGGIRFVLPETPDHRGNLHIAIESFRLSRNEVYVEVKGIFPELHMDVDHLETARENLQRVRRFISESIFPYLAQYDVPEFE